jgi:hypothetical protein
MVVKTMAPLLVFHVNLARKLFFGNISMRKNITSYNLGGVILLGE